jgi:anti-sigma28 factor (negative regulator of flagellin synthesis)
MMAGEELIDENGVICKLKHSYPSSTERKAVAMTQDKLIKYHQVICDQARLLMKAKNNDYGSTDDPFENFTQAERENITSTERGILVRLSDKMSRIRSFINKGSYEVDENFEDTIVDAVNYLILLAAYINTKNGGARSC